MTQHEVPPGEPLFAASRFEHLQALSRLEWFEPAGSGRVTLKDRSVGPIIDMHGHLALGYGGRLQVDVWHCHDAAEHYLPISNALDLDVYVNRNFTPAQLAEMKRDLTLRSLGRHGMRRTHTAPNLIREMDELGIAATVLLPIDFPAFSHNARAYLDVARAEPRLISLGSVHPYAVNPEQRLDAQIAMGARGIKVHPAVQLIRPDDPRANRLYRMCGERGIPVLWHCGPVGIEPRLGRYLSQVRWYERPIAENPRTTFILGHAGGLQPEEAKAFCRRYPNVVLELASQSLPVIRGIVTEVDADRIVYGSDWPFYHQAIALAKVLIATRDRPELRRPVLHDNAARILGL